MVSLVRTDSSNPDFISLVTLLDDDLAIRDGDDHAFYDQFNRLDSIKYCIVGYNNDTPIVCGAIKEYDENTVEIKRMYTEPDYRGKGMAAKILTALEAWALELGYKYSILETGIRQPEAIALYKKMGYVQTHNYGQYEDVNTSLCFQKTLHLSVKQK